MAEMAWCAVGERTHGSLGDAYSSLVVLVGIFNRYQQPQIMETKRRDAPYTHTAGTATKDVDRIRAHNSYLHRQRWSRVIPLVFAVHQLPKNDKSTK